MEGGVASGLAIGALGDVIGELGERLCAADADTYWNADPLQDALAYRVTSGHEVAADAAHADEALVDAVDLLLRSKAGGDRRHAVAHVAVEREVRRQGDDAGVGELLPDLEPGRTHRDAERLGLVAARDRAAVVVAQDDDRPPQQAGPEHPLAAHVEVVAVDEREHGLQVMKRLIVHVTTPQMVSVCREQTPRLMLSAQRERGQGGQQEVRAPSVRPTKSLCTGLSKDDFAALPLDPDVDHAGIWPRPEPSRSLAERTTLSNSPCSTRTESPQHRDAVERGQPEVEDQGVVRLGRNSELAYAPSPIRSTVKPCWCRPCRATWRA